MNHFRILSVLIVLLTVTVSCSKSTDLGAKKQILIIIENRLLTPLNPSINQYKEDLENERYIVKIHSRFTSSNLPIEVRSLIQNEFGLNKNLIGAVFIGNIAAPLFNDKEKQGDPYWHDYLADFFYMDLDGIWKDNDNNGVYDEHLDSENELISKIKRKLGLCDNRTPEIWVSRIRADKLVSLGEEINLLKGYFNKNHEYRTGKMELPPKRAFLVSAGVNLEKSDWGAYPEKLYTKIDSEIFHDTLGTSLRKFLGSKVGYEWGVINVFSGPRIHHFSHFNNEIDPNWWKSIAGRQQIADYSDKINNSNDVSWSDIKLIQPNVLFYHLLTSEVGRHDYVDNLGSTYIFSGSGLVAIAGTQHSGSVGSKILYDNLVLKKSIGEAWKKALDWLVENSEQRISIFYYPNEEEKLFAGKSNYKAVLIGDGTLKLPKR